MYFTMCDYGVKVTAEIEFRETEEEDQQLNLKSSKPSSKATKDSKKLSPKKSPKKKGIWNAELVLAVLEIAEM